MNLHPSKLYRVYLDQLNFINVGDFSWDWILKDFYPVSKRERKICRRMSTSSINRHIRRIHVVFVLWTSKKCTKKRACKAVALLIKPLVFWRCCCRRRRRRRRNGCLSSLVTTFQQVFAGVNLFALYVTGKFKLRANGCNNSQQCYARLLGAKSLTGFTTTCNRVQCKRTQHVTSNNVCT